MAEKDIYLTIRQGFRDIVERRRIHQEIVTVQAPDYGDAAGLAGPGKEIKLIAEYDGANGECWTSFPRPFQGTLEQIMAMDMENDPADRSIYIAAINAVMNRYELADECLHCREADEEACAEQIARQYKKNNGNVRVLLAGYQPHMIKALSAQFPLRVLDLDPENIGKTIYGVTVEDGATAYSDAAWWAEVILCTGSAISNGTIYDYIKLPKDVSFYGTTIAGAARILDLRRICPFGRNRAG